MKFKNYLNEVTNSNRIYSKREIREMKMREFFDKENEILSQYNSIGLPMLSDLKNSPNVNYVEDPNEVFGGRWESMRPAGVGVNDGLNSVIKGFYGITGGAAPVQKLNSTKTNTLDREPNSALTSMQQEVNVKSAKPLFNTNTQKRVEERIHDFSKIMEEANILKKEIIANKNAFRELLLTQERDSGNINVKENARDALEQLLGTVNDFMRNYNEMKEANFIGADKYFHAKANCEGAQRGKFGELTAKSIGDLRELTDLFRNILTKGYSLKTTLEDKREDLEANKYGREQGRKYPNGNNKVLVDKYRPAKLPPNY